VLATAGATLEPLRRVSVFAVRSGDGPQGVPVNRTARAAGVLGWPADPAWRLEVTYAGRTTSYARADLEADGADDLRTCRSRASRVERDRTWTGVRLADLVRSVGAPAHSRVFVRSLQRRGGFTTSELPAEFVEDPLTLLALSLGGQALDLDHGFPCRLIAPARPGVMQTKWLQRIEVQS
jgi:DMSO/TMAO reductase YedYZ molybdopterin-dependent catalytic subunit